MSAVLTPAPALQVTDDETRDLSAEGSLTSRRCRPRLTPKVTTAHGCSRRPLISSRPDDTRRRFPRLLR
jgi:hypothetical protein